MRLIKPTFEILSPSKVTDGIRMLRVIERAGRTCYKSEDKITNQSSGKFVEMLLSRGHESVLEHTHASVRIVCDRGVSHELVRHRLASFSQESTRYCNYSKDKHNNQLTFILPPWVNIEEGEYSNMDLKEIHTIGSNGDTSWFMSMLNAESTYLGEINAKWQPQQARSVLPNSLKTEIVVTSNLRHWREIFKQRTAKAAHPQMREIMIPLLKEMKNRIPIIFDDIKV
jgi:thymidylate synthase (FAD)